MSLSPFDRRQLRLRSLGTDTDFIAVHSAEHLQQLLLCLRGEFKRVLLIGKAPERLIAAVQKLGQIEQITYLGFAEKACALAEMPITALHADEECLPFADGVFDLIVSNMTLHWVNDIPGVLQQAKRVLRPGGLYLASFYGGSTLKELRQAFLIADSEGPLGVAPRLCEFMELTTAAQLMQQSGFKDPVADRSLLEVAYDQVNDLLVDLKNMQETSIMKERPKGLTSWRAFERVKAAYEANASTEHSGILATVELFNLTGWKT